MTDSPATPRTAEPCARYWGSDGTLCAVHHGRFASSFEWRCFDRRPVR